MRKDISGVRFGRLVAIKEVEPSNKMWRYLCLCDCGKEKVILKQSLMAKKTKSCGCLHMDNRNKLYNNKGKAPLG